MVFLSMLDFLIVLQVKVKLNVNVKFDEGILLNHVTLAMSNAKSVCRFCAAIRNGVLGIRSLPAQAKNSDHEGDLCVPSAGF